MKHPAVEKRWAVCPYCKAKVIMYDNTADCSGVFLKCSRRCHREFELIIESGKQVFKT